MPVIDPDLAVVILAAGLSRRLGVAKQLIRRQHQPLVTHTIALAKCLKPADLWVVLPHIDTAWARQLYQEVDALAVKVIDNPTPETGMAQSIRLAIKALKEQGSQPHRRVLFLTIDQVALTVADLRRLSAVTAIDELTVSRYGQATGVPVNLPFRFLAEFAERLQGDQGFRRLWHNEPLVSPRDGLRYRLHAIDLPHLGQDIDTLAQFEQLQSAYDLTLPR